MWVYFCVSETTLVVLGFDEVFFFFLFLTAP